MLINNQTDITNKITYRGRKIPRYLYHITTEANCKKIQNTGYILPSVDYLSQKRAVFCLEWQNFIKRWGGLSKDNDIPFLSKITFFEYLLRGKGKRNITILRIPTDKLEQENLFVRSQDMLFSMCEDYQTEYRQRNPILKEKFPHLFDWDNAVNAKKYKSKKHSIEYIYTKKIPVDIIEKIGIAELKLQNCDNNINLLRFLKRILSNTKEKNSLKIYEK